MIILVLIVKHKHLMRTVDFCFFLILFVKGMFDFANFIPSLLP